MAKIYFFHFFNHSVAQLLNYSLPKQSISLKTTFIKGFTVTQASPKMIPQDVMILFYQHKAGKY